MATKTFRQFVNEGGLDQTIYNNWIRDVESAEKSYSAYLSSTDSTYNKSYYTYANVFDSLSKRGKKIKNMISSGAMNIKDDGTTDRYLGYLTSAKKNTESVASFYDQFKDEDSFYNWSFGKKYSGKTATDIDSIIDKLTLSGHTTKNTERELEWLRLNRDSFMTADEISAEIKARESSSSQLKADKWRTGLSSVAETLSSGLSGGLNLGTSVQPSREKAQDAKAAETENNARLNILKKMLAEKMSDEELGAMHREADSHSILDVFRSDYTFADYANDKDNESIYGAALRSRENAKNRELIDSDSEIRADLAAFTGVVGKSKNAPGNPLSFISDSVREDEVIATSSELQSIIKKWDDRGYDFESIYKTFKSDYNADLTEAITKQAEEYTAEHPILANIASVGGNLVGGVATLPESISTGIKDLFTDDVLTMDTNSPAWAVKNSTDAIRNVTTEMIENSDNGKLKAFLYQTGMSTADFLAATAATGFNQPATLLLMGSNSAVDTMKNVTEKGGSASQALGMGVLSGTFEILLEKVPLDNIISSVKTSSGKAWLQNIVNSMLSEGFEELGTDLANTAVDILINANQSEISQQTYKYMSEGMSASEASSKALMEKAANMGLSFLGGALSGGVMSGVGGGFGLAQANKAYSNIGSNVNSYNDGADAVMQLARELVASEQNGNGTLASDLSKAEKKQSNRNIGRLYTDTVNAVETQTQSLAKTEALKEIQERVEALGMDKSTSKKAAEIIYKAYTGEKLTARQQSILKNNKYAQRAYRELSASDTENGLSNYSNEWVRAVNERISAATQSSYDSLGAISQYGIKNTAQTDGETRYSIKTDTDGNKFVDVNSDIFDETDGRSHASVIAEVISTKFGNLINANGQDIRINSTTNAEWRRSPSAQKLIRSSPEVYYDKLKSIANADELLEVSKNWVGEEVSHTRNDDITEFARGAVDYKVGDNGYSADVLVAIKKDNTALLYDIINIKSKKIEDASRGSHSDTVTSRQETSSGENISQSTDKVKPAVLMSAEEKAKKAAVIEKTGEQVTVSNIVRKTDNGVIAELTSGDEVYIPTSIGKSDASSAEIDVVRFSDNDMNAAVIYASNYENPQTANVFLKAVAASPVKNVADFSRAFNAAYLQGLRGEKLNTNGISITKEQARLAYISGQEDSKKTQTAGKGRVDGEKIADIVNMNAYKNGVTRLDTAKKLTENQKNQLTVLDAYGKKYGISIITVDTYESGKVNASMIGQKNIILALDTQGEAYLAVAGHEVYHYLEKHNPDDAAKLREGVINYLKQNDKYDYDERFNELSKLYGTDDADIIESEITANSMFDVLSNEETIKELAKEQPSLLKKIKQALESFIKKLKECAAVLEWKEQQVLKDDIVALTSIKQMFDMAMKNIDTSKNTAQTDGVVRYSINEDFEKQLHSWDGKTEGFSFVVGNTSAALKQAGVPDKQIRWDATKLKKTLNKHVENGISIGVLKNVPQLLESPIVIVDSRTVEDRLIVLGELYDDFGKVVVVALELNPTNRKGTVLENIIKIATSQGRSHIQSLLSSNIRYMSPDEKRVQNWLNVNRLQLPLRSTNLNSVNSISQNETTVNNQSMQNGKKDTPRYSRKETALASATREQLLKENAELRSANAILQDELKLTNGGVLSRDNSKRLAMTMVDYFNSSYDVSELADELYDIFKWYDGEDSTYNYLMDYLTKVGESVIAESSTLDTTLYDEYAETREWIRNMRFALPEHVLRQLNENYSGKFHQATFGKMRLVSKAKNPDVMYLSEMYSELADAYPNFFSVEDNEYEQPQKLLDFWNAIQPTYIDTAKSMGFKTDMEAAVGFAYTTFEKYMEMPSYRTFADRKKDQIETKRAEFARNLKEAKKRFREERDEKVEETKKYYRDMMDRQREKRKETQLRASMRKDVIGKVKKLSEMLTRPTNQKHIPEQLKGMVAEFLTIFTGDSVVLSENTVNRVRDAYESILNDESGDLECVRQYYDPEILDKLKKLAYVVRQVADGKRLAKLDVFDMNTLVNITDHFYHLVTNANDIFIGEKKESFTSAINNVLTDLNLQKKDKSNKKHMLELKSFSALVYDITPYYFFKRIGGKMNELYMALLDGQNKSGILLNQAKQFTDRLAKKYNISEWKGSTEPIITFNSDTGEKIELTADQALGIYAISKRESLSGQESKHLTQGGIVFRDDKHSVTPVALSIEMIQRINNSLTKEQRAYADEMVEYLSTTVGGWGNEASLKMYGYKKFGEKYYYPFHTDENYKRNSSSGKEISDISTVSLIKDSSYTKNTVFGASTPVVVEDFTKVAGNHIAEMINYSSLAQAQSMLYSVSRYSAKGDSVMKSLENAYGEKAKIYLNTFINDISGGVSYDPNEGFANKMMRNFKIGAVAANISVVVQQPMAMARAMQLIDAKHFLTTARKDGYEELKRYSGVAVIKEMGGFDTSTGQGAGDWLMNVDPKLTLDKIKKFFSIKDSSYRDSVFGWGAGKADEMTWNHIWQAVKNEIAEKYKTDSKKLSETQLQEAGKRFNEVIEATQVYDSVLTRAQIMRNKSGLIKMATSFMAEPTKKINMLMDAAYQFYTKKDKENGKYLMRTVGSILVSTLLNALVKSVITAGRDDDEHQSFGEKYIEALISNSFSEMSILQSLPFVKDIMSLLQGYDVTRSDLDVIDALINSLSGFNYLLNDDKMAKLTESEQKKKIYNVVSDFVTSLAALKGIPLKNILRDCEGIVRTVSGFFGEDAKRFTGTGAKYSAQDALVELFANVIYNPAEDILSVNEDDIFRDISKADSEAFAEDWDKYEAYLIFNGKTEEKAYSAVKKNVKDKIKTKLYKGKISEKDAVKYLSEYLGDKNAYWTVKEWLFKHDEENEGAEWSKFLKLEKAVLAGADITDEVTELTEHNTKISSVKTKITEIIKEAFDNGDIDEERATELLTKYEGYTATQTTITTDVDGSKDINRLVDKWSGNKDLDEGEYYTAFDAVNEAVLSGMSITDAKERLYELEYTDSEIAEQIRSTIQEAYLSGDLTKSQANSKLQKYTDMSAAEATDKINYWEFKNLHPDSTLNEAAVSKYLEAETAGISLEVFTDYYERKSECTGTKDSDGKTISGSKKNEILAVIDSLPISSKQKDILYYQNNYGESNLYQAPWH